MRSALPDNSSLCLREALQEAALSQDICAAAAQYLSVSYLTSCQRVCATTAVIKLIRP
jgi:hypothetical protein